MSLPRFLLFGSKEQKNLDAVEPRAVQVAPSGGLKVWLDGMRNTFTVATSAIISSLPNVVVSSMPSLTVGSLPSVTVGSVPALTANPSRHSILYEGLLSASDATLYTAAANWRDVQIYLVNVDTSSRTATLYRGNPGSDANTILRAKTIGVEGREPVFLPALASGDKINGLCSSANTVKVEVWGVSA